MEYLLALIQCGLAAVLLMASIGKLRQRNSFVSALHMSGIKRPVAKLLGVYLPAFELALVPLIFFSPRVLLPNVFFITTCLFLVFVFWLMWVYGRGLKLSCNCFGRSINPVGRLTIFRTLAFLCIASTGLFISNKFESRIPPTTESYTFILALTVFVLIGVVSSLAQLKASKPPRYSHPAVSNGRRNFLRRLTAFIGSVLVGGFTQPPNSADALSDCANEGGCGCYKWVVGDIGPACASACDALCACHIRCNALWSGTWSIHCCRTPFSICGYQVTVDWVTCCV